MWADFPRSTLHPGLFLVLGLGSLVPSLGATPRFYLAAVEKTPEFSPQLRDKIWEWPGDDSLCARFIDYSYTPRCRTLCDITNMPINIHRLEKAVNSQS